MKHTDYKDRFSEFNVVTYLQEGDESAFKWLYDNFRPQVFHTALQYLKSSELAKEVVQDVFLKIWTDRNQIGHVLSIKAWIYTLSKNHILNRLKRIAIESRAKEYFVSSFEEEDLTTLHHVEHHEYHNLLKEAIHALPDQQRRVFELARFEKLTYEAIAKELEISPMTVKTHMARALANLRTRMGRLGFEIPLILFFIEDFF